MPNFFHQSPNPNSEGPKSEPATKRSAGYDGSVCSDDRDRGQHILFFIEFRDVIAKTNPF